MTKLPILDALPFFHDSPREVRDAMTRMAQAVILPAGAFFYREAESCPHFALVTAGDLRVFKAGDMGREVTLYHVQEGEPCLVNLLCVVLGKPAMASAQAEEETSAIVLPGAMLDPWMVASEALRRFVFEALATRMIGVMSLVEEIAFRHVDSRLAALLLEQFRRDPIISATHEEIASELGTAREVVSRTLREFARRGAIRASRGHIELRDAGILREIM